MWTTIGGELSTQAVSSFIATNDDVACINFFIDSYYSFHEDPEYLHVQNNLKNSLRRASAFVFLEPYQSRESRIPH